MHVLESHSGKPYFGGNLKLSCPTNHIRLLFTRLPRRFRNHLRPMSIRPTCLSSPSLIRAPPLPPFSYPPRHPHVMHQCLQHGPYRTYLLPISILGLHMSHLFLNSLMMTLSRLLSFTSVALHPLRNGPFINRRRLPGFATQTLSTMPHSYRTQSLLRNTLEEGKVIPFAGQAGPFFAPSLTQVTAGPATLRQNLIPCVKIATQPLLFIFLETESLFAAARHP